MLHESAACALGNIVCSKSKRTYLDNQWFDIRFRQTTMRTGRKLPSLPKASRLKSTIPFDNHMGNNPIALSRKSYRGNSSFKRYRTYFKEFTASSNLIYEPILVKSMLEISE